MDITPEQAKAELARRELERRGSSGQTMSAPDDEKVSLPQKILGNLVDAGKKTAETAGVALNTVGFGVPGVVSQLATGGKLTGEAFPMVEGGTNVFEGKDLSGGEQVAANVAGAAIPVGAVGKAALSTILKFDSSLKQAQKAKEAIDGIRNTLGQATALAIKDVASEPTNLKWMLKSDRAVNAMRNPVYGVKFDRNGAVVQTVANLNKVKDALGDLIGTPALWEEAGKKELQHIKLFYGQVNDAMKVAARKAGKPIDEALDAYSNFMDNYHMINKTIVDKAGNAMGNKLKKTFELFAEPAYKEAWKEVAKTSPEIRKIAVSQTNRVMLKNLLKVTGVAAAGTGAVKIFTH